MIESSSEVSLGQLLRQRELEKPANDQWVLPTQYDLTEPGVGSELKSFLEAHPEVSVVDGIGIIAAELAEVRLSSGTDEQREAMVRDILVESDQWGSFFYFPCDNRIVRYPSRADHEELLTARNRQLITAEEQSVIGGARLAVYGQSVGSRITEELVRSGVGIGGTYHIADFDRIGPTNLNRISAGQEDLGLPKVDRTARSISRLNPYTRQVHLRDGVTPEYLAGLVKGELDLIFDEVDNLRAKAEIREKARELGVPVLMATDLGQRVYLDVERYDLADRKAKPFHGRIGKKDYERILAGDIADEERIKLVAKVAAGAVPRVSSRMVESLLALNRGELAGFPQLSTDAGAAASMATDAAREILIGGGPSSGRYPYRPRKILGLSAHPDGAKRTAQAYKQLIKS
jgi:tRNA threonylcarbamoyladenosine dehydratase